MDHLVIYTSRNTNGPIFPDTIQHLHNTIKTSQETKLDEENRFTYGWGGGDENEKGKQQTKMERRSSTGKKMRSTAFIHYASNPPVAFVLSHRI
jgi:hypothetical protein